MCLVLLSVLCNFLRSISIKYRAMLIVFYFSFQTLSVSMLLRYSHHQIFMFIGESLSLIIFQFSFQYYLYRGTMLRHFFCTSACVLFQLILQREFPISRGKLSGIMILLFLFSRSPANVGDERHDRFSCCTAADCDTGFSG